MTLSNTDSNTSWDEGLPEIKTTKPTFTKKSSIIDTLKINPVKREKLQKRAQNFADEVSAHGVSKIVNSKVVWIKVFWFVITLISFVGFGAMTAERITMYNVSKETITYTSTTSYNEDGLELPSISICQEGFNTDFVLRDIVLEYDEKLRVLMEKPEGLIESLYEAEFWGRNGLKEVDFNFNHFKFMTDWVDDSVADFVYNQWVDLELRTNTSIGFINEPLNITSEVTPLFFRDESGEDELSECEVGCCRNFVTTYTMLEETVSKAVVEILLNACVIGVEYAPTAPAGSAPGVPGIGLAVVESEITTDVYDIDFKVSYDVLVNDADYVNSQLLEIAAPILLEKYTSEYDHFYNDSVEFLEHFTDFMGKHSNYSQSVRFSTWNYPVLEGCA